MLARALKHLRTTEVAPLPLQPVAASRGAGDTAPRTTGHQRPQTPQVRATCKGAREGWWRGWGRPAGPSSVARQAVGRGVTERAVNRDGTLSPPAPDHFHPPDTPPCLSASFASPSSAMCSARSTSATLYVRQEHRFPVRSHHHSSANAPRQPVVLTACAWCNELTRTLPSAPYMTVLRWHPHLP